MTKKNLAVVEYRVTCPEDGNVGLLPCDFHHVIHDQNSNGRRGVCVGFRSPAGLMLEFVLSDCEAGRLQHALASARRLLKNPG